MREVNFIMMYMRTYSPISHCCHIGELRELPVPGNPEYNTLVEKQAQKLRISEVATPTSRQTTFISQIIGVINSDKLLSLSFHSMRVAITHLGWPESLSICHFGGKSLPGSL